MRFFFFYHKSLTLFLYLSILSLWPVSSLSSRAPGWLRPEWRFSATAPTPTRVSRARFPRPRPSPLHRLTSNVSPQRRKRLWPRATPSRQNTTNLPLLLPPSPRQVSPTWPTPRRRPVHSQQPRRRLPVPPPPRRLLPSRGYNTRRSSYPCALERSLVGFSARSSSRSSRAWRVVVDRRNSSFRSWRKWSWLKLRTTPWTRPHRAPRRRTPIRWKRHQPRRLPRNRSILPPICSRTTARARRTRTSKVTKRLPPPVRYLHKYFWLECI